MKTLMGTVLLLMACAGPGSAGTVWILDQSTLTYHADHSLHKTAGHTNAAKGKGVCEIGGCDFLVAVPVNTFDSGDANRDLHMIQAVNGGENPMVSVRVHLPSEPTAPMKSDVLVDFGGRQVTYKDVSFEVFDKTATGFKVKTIIPLVLSNHNVKRPSLMGIAVKDKAPVDVETAWVKK